MTEEIINAITEAESEAVRIGDRAREEAAAILSRAEVRAAEIEKSSEEVCRAYRDTQRKAAEAEAEKAYRSALAEKGEDARRYADRLLESTGDFVGKIVGRIVRGDR